MLIASGPATLNTALAADVYGQYSVIAASIAFSLGCLSATRATSFVSELGLGLRTVWSVWSVGMAAGWLLAPWNIAGLLVAQALSGLCLTAFHGEMDSAISNAAPAQRLTSALARAGALRAVGSAGAVRLLPLLVAQIGLIGYTGAILMVVLAAYASTVATISLRRRVDERRARANVEETPSRPLVDHPHPEPVGS